MIIIVWFGCKSRLLVKSSHPFFIKEDSLDLHPFSSLKKIHSKQAEGLPIIIIRNPEKSIT